MLQKEIRHKWITAFVINLLLFVAVNIFLLPIFNSGDDVFLMYTLSGGFGDAPTNLLHYDHIWHPGLGWLIKSLYEKLPGLNWYGFILMLLQLKACTVFLYLLFKKFRTGSALLLYLVFFCFIETRILLSLNFTTTAWMIAAAGFVLLLEGTRKQKNIFYIISGFVLIMLAGLLRIHVLIAVGILLIPALFIYARKEFITWTAVIAIATGLLFLLNIQHKNYYKENIPGWEKQEEYRQALFKLGNTSENAVTLNKIDYTDNTELAFYKARFFVDTGFISITKLKQLGKALKNESHFSLKDSFGGLYWLFMELRVYLILFAVCIFLLWHAGILKIFFRHWLIPFFICAGAYFFLSVFTKKNIHIHVPEGAVPKDGPSAGITMMTAIASALTEKRVRPFVAMTGEITLRGQVLPVGGIKEKVLAAKRAGIKEIILCRQNEKDVSEIDSTFIKGVKFHYVKTMKEVLDLALEQ